MEISARIWFSTRLLGPIVASILVACGGSSFQSGNSAGGTANAGSGDRTNGGASTTTSGGAISSGGTDPTPTGGAAGVGDAGSQGEAGAGSPGSAYRQAILDARPLAYWRMGASQNRTVADETGGGNDLVLQGTGHQLGIDGAIQGDDDGAMGFDGAASFAIASDPRALDFAARAPFTLECWARRTAGGASYFQHLFSNLDGSAGNRDGYALWLLPEPGAGDSVRSAFEYDQPAAEHSTNGPVPAEAAWAYYAAVYDGQTISLYVDGTLASTAAAAGSSSARSEQFVVARAAAGGTTFFKGALDELAVYPRALGAAEVAKHFGFAKSLSQ